MEKPTDFVPIGERMKTYEVDTTVPNDRPFMIRIDGHKFSKFTRDFTKPYDPYLAETFRLTCQDLLSEFNPRTIYQQSDEISLIFTPTVEKNGSGQYVNYPFNGRVQKLASLVASFTGVRFNHHLRLVFDQNKKTLPWFGLFEKVGCAHFDARVFSLISDVEVFNNIFWRSSHDCVRNAVSSFARQYFSDREMHHKSTQDLKEMMLAKKVDYDQVADPRFKYGSFFKKQMVNQSGVDHHGEAIEFVRTVPFQFVLHLTKFDPRVLELLVGKYYDASFESLLIK